MARLTKKIKQEIRTNSFNNDDYLLNVEDAAEMLSCSLAYIYKLSALGKITAVRWPQFNDHGIKVRKSLRFQKSDILDFIEQNKLRKI